MLALRLCPRLARARSIRARPNKRASQAPTRRGLHLGRLSCSRLSRRASWRRRTRSTGCVRRDWQRLRALARKPVHVHALLCWPVTPRWLGCHSLAPRPPFLVLGPTRSNGPQASGLRSAVSSRLTSIWAGRTMPLLSRRQKAAATISGPLPGSGRVDPSHGAVPFYSLPAALPQAGTSTWRPPSPTRSAGSRIRRAVHEDEHHRRQRDDEYGFPNHHDAVSVDGKHFRSRKDSASSSRGRTHRTRPSDASSSQKDRTYDRPRARTPAQSDAEDEDASAEQHLSACESCVLR